MLPLDGTSYLVSWFSIVAASGGWPDGFATSLMAILGKPAGGERTVAKNADAISGMVSVPKAPCYRVGAAHAHLGCM